MNPMRLRGSYKACALALCLAPTMPLAHADAPDNQSVVLSKPLDVYSLKEPYDKKGMLEEESNIFLLGDGTTPEMRRIRFNLSSNEQAEAQCRRSDLDAMLNATVSANKVCKPKRVTVAFSPRGEASSLILKELKRAQESVDVAMFVLSNEEIIDALCFLAYKRKTPVRVFTDEGMKHPSVEATLQRLAAHGVHIYVEHDPNGKMHMKCAVMDGQVVLSGASNWTKNSFAQNFEDTVAIESPELAAEYTDFFNTLVQEFDEYETTDFAAIQYVQSYPDIPPSPPATMREPTSLDQVVAPAAKTFLEVDSVRVFFSPRDQTVDRAMSLIQSATQSVHTALYFISNPEVFSQMVAMKFSERGIAASLMVGGDLLSPGLIKAYRQLIPAGMAVYYEISRGLMHLKSTLIDEQTLITGSSNWSEGANQRNYEDLLVFDSPALTVYYKDYLDTLRGFCEKLTELKIAGHYDEATKTRLFRLDQLTPEPAFAVDARTRYLSNEEYLPVALDLINNAFQSIYISLYEIAKTKEPRASIESLIEALIRAAGKGIYVYVLLDCPNNVDSSLYKSHFYFIERLRAGGVDARFASPGISLHEKMMVVDDINVIIGSHNWSNGALTGSYESSALLRLPQQDSRFTDYILSHASVRPAFTTEELEEEVNLHKHIMTLKGHERISFLQQLP